MRRLTTLSLGAILALSTTSSLLAQNSTVNSLVLKSGAYKATLTAPALSGNVSIELPLLPSGGSLLGADPSGNVGLQPGAYIQLTEPAGSGGTNFTRIVAGGQAADYIWTLPTTTPTAGDALVVSAIAGNDVTLGWATPSGGGGGGGTVSKDSSLTGDGSVGSPLGLHLGRPYQWTGQNTWTGAINTFTGYLESRNEPFVLTNTDNQANELRWQEASSNGSNYMSMRAPASISTNQVYTWPSGTPTAGQVLRVATVSVPSNANIGLEWAPAAGGASVADVTVVNGDNNDITVPDGATVVRLTGATAAFNIDGFSGGTDGRVITVLNLTGQNCTFNYNMGNTVANGVMDLGTPANTVTVGSGLILLIYDATQSRWIVLSART